MMSAAEQTATATQGPVKIVGTGLLGTSIGLGLSMRGVEVLLSDVSPSSLSLATHLGAGRPFEATDKPKLVVVAAPPEITGGIVVTELDAHPEAIITDVASVKVAVRNSVENSNVDATRYVGSHPLAGRERNGPTAAVGDLFVGRPWVIAVGEGTAPRAVLMVRDMVVDLGGIPMTLKPTEHDQAVALISHLPQVISSLVAARLVSASHTSLELAGQGLRDVTRIAASDPSLWVQILALNAPYVVEYLRDLHRDLGSTIDAMDSLALTNELPEPAALLQIASVIERGNDGQALIPGKHGSRPTEYDEKVVLIPDRVGQLGRLFEDVGEAGFNIEDLELEHSPRHPTGMARISVLPGCGEELERALIERGWTIVG